MQHHSAVIPRLQLSVHEIAQEVAKKSTKRLKTTEKRQLPDSPGLGYSGEEVPRGVLNGTAELQSCRAKVK